MSPPPSAQVIHVPGAGHSMQGRAPLELAATIGRSASDP